ncbi:MAG: methyltransferase domain-containing protein [Planctomycetes bacterium]|nr:methyltransferase domain-containing protein [Planctomycetota bacterium]
MPIELEGARRFGADDYGASFVAGQRARYARGLYESRVRWVQRYLEGLALEERRWLDAGVGIGVFARELAQRGAEVIGLDFAPAVLAEARTEVPEARLLRADLERLPLRTATCDGALALDVLEHLVEPRLLLAELARVLRPGAPLLLSTDNARTPSRWRGLRRVFHAVRRRGASQRELERVRREFPSPSNHVRLYAPSEVLQLLRVAGFRVRRWDSFPRQASAWIARALETPLATALLRGWRGGELLVLAERSA